MRELLQRLRRLLGQSRIRLSGSDLRPPELSIGDRYRIGARTWTIEADRGGFFLELHAEEGSPRSACLRRVGGPEGSWLLEDGDGAIPFDWPDVLHFPGDVLL